MDTTDYVSELKECLDEMYHQVRKKLKISGEAMKRHHDVKARTTNLEDG